MFHDGVTRMVAFPTAFVVQALNLLTRISVIRQLGLQSSNPVGQRLEPCKLGTSMIYGGFTVVGDDGESVVCSYIDRGGMSRVLGIECVSVGIQPLFRYVCCLDSDWMLDTKLVCRFVVDELQPAIVTGPLCVAFHFQCDALVMLEVVPFFEDFANTEL